MLVLVFKEVKSVGFCTEKTFCVRLYFPLWLPGLRSPAHQLQLILYCFGDQRVFLTEWVWKVCLLVFTLLFCSWLSGLLEFNLETVLYSSHALMLLLQTVLSVLPSQAIH